MIFIHTSHSFALTVLLRRNVFRSSCMWRCNANDVIKCNFKYVSFIDTT